MAHASGAADMAGAERNSCPVVEQLRRAVDIGGDGEGRCLGAAIDTESAAVEPC